MTELPLLDRSARLDMLDYYEARMEARGTNTMGGTSVMTEKTDSTLTIRLTDLSTWHMEILPHDQVPRPKKNKREPKGIPVRTTHTLNVPNIPPRTCARIIYL